MQSSLIRSLPLLACVRDRSGRILAVTDRLAELEHRRPSDLIGRNVVDIWPQSAPWLELDRLALKARKPLVRIERARGGWVRSTRIPRGKGRIVWIAEDVDAAVQVQALKTMLRAAVRPSAVRPLVVPGDEKAVEMLLSCGDPTLDDVALAVSALPSEAIARVLRLAR